MSFVTTHSFTYNYYSGHKEQKVHEFSNGDESYCFIELPHSKYSIIDKEYMNDVMKYNWIENNGYIKHTKRANEKENDNTHTIYLHFLIKKLQSGDDNFAIEKHVTSVDHINRQPFDNRVSNLRIASNSEQNDNQKMRSDKSDTTLDELQQVGITEYPRHIRYDKTQKRFLIENHPELKLREGDYKRVNGTRKKTIIERYLDVLGIGYELDQDWLKRNNLSNNLDFEGVQIIERLACLHLVKCFNEHFGSELINIEKINESFASGSSFKTQIDYLISRDQNLKDPSVVYEEKGFVLTKQMKKQLTQKHVFFTQPTISRGCKFTYDFRHSPTDRKYNNTSSSKLISLEDKYNECVAPKFVLDAKNAKEGAAKKTKINDIVVT